VSSKNYLWVILSFLTRRKDAPEEVSEEIKETEVIEEISENEIPKDQNEVSKPSFTQRLFGLFGSKPAPIEIVETPAKNKKEETDEVAVIAKEVVAAKATYKEKLLNFFRIVTRSNPKQDPVIEEVLAEVASELEEEAVKEIIELEDEESVEVTELEEKAAEEIIEEEVVEEITEIVEEATEEDLLTEPETVIEETKVEVSEESCDNLPEEPSLRDQLWGFLGCGGATEEVADSVVDVLEEATEEVIEQAVEEVHIEEATEEILVADHDTEVEVSEESCDNLPEEPSLRDQLWGYLGCGVATEEVVESEVDVIEEATEEVLVADPETAIESETEVEVSEESCDNLPEEPTLRDQLWGFLGCGVATEEVVESEVDVIEEATEEVSAIESETEPEVQSDTETEEVEEVEVSLEESCDNLPEEQSLRDKLWSFLGCGDATEEVANSETEAIEGEVLPEAADDVETEQMEAEEGNILTTEEPDVEDTVEEDAADESSEEPAMENLSVPLCLNDSEGESEGSVSLPEETLPSDVQIQIKG